MIKLGGKIDGQKDTYEKVKGIRLEIFIELADSEFSHFMLPSESDLCSLCN